MISGKKQMFIRSLRLLIPFTIHYLFIDDLIVAARNNGIIVRKYSNPFNLIIHRHIAVHAVSQLFIKSVIEFNRVPIRPLKQFIQVLIGRKRIADSYPTFNEVMNILSGSF
ncbi:hypothetical protein D3C76_1219820 [compost metagenome]